ncbi:MAG: nucleotidyltransferase domain-containing protein [Gammaproteobacteria bacterium]|nr:nucleotidyltransferase domain-containing protein [Gammaproteobacteria bacterium]MYD77276.1 nucleotidyltransferase domain-containing protein [Gammaproteobacteria bacterium]
MKTPGNATISPDVRKRIEEKLDDIERENSVRILLAVESGSRAWGFPSPDSDYDVRFLYARPRDWYLSIDVRRDVIECPIEDMLDINGWDIRKALGLLLKANPVLSEWLRSPVRYREDRACTQRLRALADRIAFARPAHFHYLHLGRSAYDSKIGDHEAVATKKYFYAIRPALALRWLRIRPDPPPMDLPGLRAGLQLERELDEAIERLVVAKAEAAELGTGPRIGEIDRFIEGEFALAGAASVPSGAGDPDLLEDANRVFCEIVDEGP